MTQHHSEKVLEKAWMRIGLSPWDQMAWYVKLANADLGTLSPGDMLNWQDEFVAIETARSEQISALPPRNSKRYWQPKNWKPPASERPTIEQMLEVQELLAPHLTALADGRDTQTRILRIGYAVRFRKTSAEEERAGYPRYQVIRGEYGEPTSNIYASTLLHRMTRLLEDFADSIRRCEHCKKMFLQIKRNARYCGRACHSVAGMQRLRAGKKSQALPKTKRKKQGLTAPPSKGEERHGRKR